MEEVAKRSARTAYHEAGHIVAALAFGEAVLHADILADGQRDGRTRVKNIPGECGGRVFDKMEFCTYHWSGYVSEIIKFPKSHAAALKGAQDDLQSMLACDPDEALSKDAQLRAWSIMNTFRSERNAYARLLLEQGQADAVLVRYIWTSHGNKW